MPITWTKEGGWTIKDATPEELLELMEIGRVVVVNGLAGDFVAEEYKTFLKFAPDTMFYKE